MNGLFIWGKWDSQSLKNTCWIALEKHVLVKKGTSVVYNRSANDEKECLTVLIVVDADGGLPPPMILFPYKRVPQTVLQKMPNKWGFGRSDSGWMTCETFYEYITNVFYPYLITKKTTFPVILFVDGHSSHISLHLNEFCKEKKIILVTLFPNATHILQPLDVAVFHPLKMQWKKAVYDWKIQNNGERLKREDFAPLLENCLNIAAKPETIRHGFNTCGLFPFTPESIDFSKLLPTEINENVIENTVDIIETNTSNPEKTKFIQDFEKGLGTIKLNTFLQSGSNWDGDVLDTNLFYY